MFCFTSICIFAISVAYLITKKNAKINKVGLPVPAEVRASIRVPVVVGPVDEAEPMLRRRGRPRSAVHVGTPRARSAEPLRQVGGGLQSPVDRLAPSPEAQRQLGVEVDGFGGGLVQPHHGGGAALALGGGHEFQVEGPGVHTPAQLSYSLGDKGPTAGCRVRVCLQCSCRQQNEC